MHAQILFDLEKHGEEQLQQALRKLPVGGSIKLKDSGIGVRRIGGGRLFAPVVSPKVTVRPDWTHEELKSATTAAPALARAHKGIMEAEGQAH